MNNDRFKFRVWDKKTNKYDYDVTFLFNTSSVYMDGHKIVNLFRGQTCYAIANSKDIIIEQCVGLKDKNGKLIYFGDLLKDKYGRILTPAEEFVNSEFMMYFKNTDDEFITGLGLKAGYSTDCEIIGTIHDKE